MRQILLVILTLLIATAATAQTTSERFSTLDRKTTDLQKQVESLKREIASLKPRKFELWNTVDTYPEAKYQMTEYGWKDAPVIYCRPDNGILVPDPADPWKQKPLLDEHGLEIVSDAATCRAAIASMVPADYTGPVTIDFEGKVGEALYLESPVAKVALSKMLTLLRHAKAARPLAKFGFYGIPQCKFYGPQTAIGPQALTEIEAWFRRWHTEVVGPLLSEVDNFQISFYDGVWGQSWTLQWESEVRALLLKLALEYAKGKPVYVYCWKRYRNNGRMDCCLGDTLVSPQEWASLANTIKTVNYNGQYARGVMLWGADPYLLVSLGVNTFQGTTPPADSEYYWPVMRARALVAIEVPPGKSVRQHIIDSDDFTYHLVAHLLNDYPMGARPFYGHYGTPIVVSAPPPPPPPSPAGFGDFMGPDTFTKGVDAGILFFANQNFPSGGYVTFQATLPDSKEPVAVQTVRGSTIFIYSNEFLQTIPDGKVTIHAIIFSADGKKVGSVSREYSFVTEPANNRLKKGE